MEQIKLRVDSFDVTIRPGKSRSRVTYSMSFECLHYAYIEVPPDMMHPIYQKHLLVKLNNLIDKWLGKLAANGVTHYLPGKNCHNFTFPAFPIRQAVKNLYPDVDLAKEAWDYNTHTVNEKPKGKYGDLKAFLEFRKGSELDLISEGK